MTLTLGELSGLELFLDTLRLGSISAAARLHHMSQPSATERLHTLETRIGISLLQRGPSGSAPTLAGEAVAQWAQPILAAVQAMDAGVSALRATTAQHPLTVIASLTVAEYVLPAWLHRHRLAAGGPVELRMGNSTSVAAAVAAGEAQLGFVESPHRYAGLRSTVVGGDQLVVVVAPDHAWAKRRSRLSVAELAATPLLAREPGSGTRDAYQNAIRAAGATPSPPLAVMASTTTLKSAVAAGDGAAVISELAVAVELSNGVLIAVPVTGLDLRRDFRALWRPSSRDRAMQAFLRLVRAS
jgi:DNA-binding transcriptional LysR family regulator